MNTVTLDLDTLSKLLQDAAALASTQTLCDMGLLKPYISQNAACKKYGRRIVEGWIQKGLIEPIKDGQTSTTIRLDRVKLEAIAKTANRRSYKTIETK